MSDDEIYDEIKEIVDETPGMRMMGDAELVGVLDQMQAARDARPDAPDILPPAPINFIPSGTWDDKEDDILRLLTPAEFEQVPDGAMLVDIFGKVEIKGQDNIDLDTRFGCIASGFRDSQLEHMQ